MEATEGLFPIIWDLWRSSLPQVLSRSELWFFCGINLATWGVDLSALVENDAAFTCGTMSSKNELADLKNICEQNQIRESPRSEH